jgi:L-cysteine S-thiosulfotransferase
MMKKYLILAGLAALALPTVVSLNAQQQKIDPAIVDRYVAATWKGAPEAWKTRVTQDDTQRICTASANNPQGADFDKILAREQASVVYPADGNVVGDWKKGERVAQVGTGGQFSDAADGPRGGNCYACHQIAPKELSYGTLGPTLVGYGRDRKFDKEEAKKTYSKVFNAMSIVPCSQMPRFGYHQFLTQEQIKDVVGLLFDPESPVNK